MDVTASHGAFHILEVCGAKAPAQFLKALRAAKLVGFMLTFMHLDRADLKIDIPILECGRRSGCLLQSRWLCESLDLTSAAPWKNRGRLPRPPTHPCPYPSDSGMLRDPEHDSFFLVEMSTGEGIRISKNRLSGEKHPLIMFFDDS
jgi:hypothetical protein